MLFFWQTFLAERKEFELQQQRLFFQRQNRKETPIGCQPAFLSNKEAIDESTPPDMATTIFFPVILIYYTLNDKLIDVVRV